MSVRFPVRHPTPSIRSMELLREMLSGICAFGPDDSEQVLLREAFDRVSSHVASRQPKVTETVRGLISFALGSSIDRATAPEDSACVEQEFIRLTRALDHLVGAQNREVFLLHGLGLTYAEIGGQLNMSIENVEEHIARTLAVLSLSNV
jgi:RNA polymerase sigma factor (sigma-70 family)